MIFKVDDRNEVSDNIPMTTNETIDLGNGESVSRGIFPQHDGTFLAMTFTQSKTFKTRAGAARWLARKSAR